MLEGKRIKKVEGMWNEEVGGGGGGGGGVDCG